MFKRFFLTLSLVLVGCSSPPEVRGTKATISRVEATVSSVNSGTVEAERVAELAFGAVGRVRKLSVQLADRVNKDQLLAELENDDLQSALEMSERELVRQKELVKSHTQSVQQLDAAQREYQMTKAAFEKTQIRAPFDGMITELNLEVGQLSQITAVVPKPLMRIVDLNPRFVRAEVDEVDLSKLKLGQKARIKILAARREPFTGTLRLIIPFVSSIREQDRTSQVELNLENQDLLLAAGSSADVDIIVEEKPEALVVPTRTLISQGQERALFVLRNNLVERVPVTIGIHSYDRTEILSGITQGEMVLYPSESHALVAGEKIKLIPVS